MGLSSLYMLCLIVGGSLALVSALSGALDTDVDMESGDLADTLDVGDIEIDTDGLDLDTDLDPDLDPELDPDLDLDAELEGLEGFDVPAGTPEAVEAQLTTFLQAAELAELHAQGVEPEFRSGAETDLGGSRIFSIRGLLYGIFGFGATGTLLEWLAPGAEMMTLSFAVVAGVLTSVAVTKIVDMLRQSEAGERLTRKSYMGRLGEVLLPIEADSPGRIKLTGTYKRRELRALPFSLELYASDPSSWEEIFVVEVREGMAYVSPFNEEVRGLKSRLKRDRLPSSSEEES